MAQERVVGSFAPPLSDELLARYEAMAARASDDVRPSMRRLLDCCRAWWELPESVETDVRPHASGVGAAVALSADVLAALGESLPSRAEIQSIQAALDRIPASAKATRNAAFHLLWHVIELSLGREPITKDKIPAPNP